MAIVAAAIGAAGALGGAYLSSQNRGSGGSGGNLTSTQQVQLRPEVGATVDQLQRDARVFADQQYTPYGGTRVADFTPDYRGHCCQQRRYL